MTRREYWSSDERITKTDGLQNLDLQLDAHKKQGISENHIYNDYVSGEKDERPGLQARLQALRQVDALVV